MKKIEMKTNIDDLMCAIFRDQIHHGGDISDLGAEVYNQLVIDFGGDPEHDHLTDDQLRVYRHASEEWYKIGFRMAMQVNSLMP